MKFLSRTDTKSMKSPNKSSTLMTGAIATLAILITLVTFTLINYRSLPFENAHHDLIAEKGLLLINEPLDPEIIYVIKGKWEYYPGKLYSPEALHKEHPDPQFRDVPFREIYQGKPQTATLRIKILTKGAALQHTSIDSGLIYSSSKAWINGELAWEIGRVSDNAKDLVAAVRPARIDIPETEEIELVIQIANAHVGTFGLVSPLSIAHTSTHFNSRHAGDLINTMIIGFTFSLLIYSFFNLLLEQKSLQNRYVFLLSTAIFLKVVLQYPTVLYHPWFQTKDYLKIYALNFALYNSIILLCIFTVNEFVRNLFGKKFLIGISAVFSALFLRLCLLDPSDYYSDIFIAHGIAISSILWVFYCAFFSEAMGLRFKKSIRIGFIWTAILCLPAIALHALENRNATLIENIAYLNFVVTMSFARSYHLKKLQDRYLKEAEKRKHAYSQLIKMVYPHQLAKIKAGKSLEDTMPTGSKKDCCVICFDIIDSSNLPAAKSVLAKVFASCFELMIKNYDRYSVSSDAYRINEVGDGFYCSIGFPFDNSLEGSYAESAWFLTLQFLSVVDSISRDEGLKHPVQCSIGIAMGELSGFFTTSGIKRYDMYGEAIVLSTRYEKMRKVLIDSSNSKSHIVVLQGKVAERLPMKVRSQLQHVALGKDNMKVRNDATAENLYYQLIANNEFSSGKTKEAR